jgi:dipeptidyl aminopeptidase/acylaminoacyl peptidase
VGEGELARIDYRGIDGQDLVGWAILPFRYKKGERYPMVVWVHGGLTFGVEPPNYLNVLNSDHPLNLQLLAAHGYVVLMPSMPQKSVSETEPYLDLMKGVLPAVDKVIELGIADPLRLAVMGHSYGGYSTYGLITQTNRFRAAVALAGFSNLVSLYGTFDPRLRYQRTVHEDPFRMWYGEADIGMRSPPWKNLEKYIRNSPITYVERVQTPLLIIHGDFDPISIQQGEEFFSALYRQNKRAEFVRYWGEDHVLSSPANIRDMWYRIYAWLDAFLDVK